MVLSPGTSVFKYTIEFQKVSNNKKEGPKFLQDYKCENPSATLYLEMFPRWLHCLFTQSPDIIYKTLPRQVGQCSLCSDHGLPHELCGGDILMLKKKLGLLLE